MRSVENETMERNHNNGMHLADTFIQINYDTLSSKGIAQGSNSGNVNYTIAHTNPSQVRQTEEQIKVEFEELHQFLKEEEATRIAALREEEEEKSQRMKAKISEMNKLLTSVLEQINKIKDDMNNEDSLFLHVSPVPKKFRSTEERAKYTVPDPEVGPGVLIDVSKHLGNLRYTVWEKMKDICPY
ncbi:hypothetical protein P4O66_019109, partial [Electrophorus voltai]